MQKIISSILYIISLLILVLSLSQNFSDTLASEPLFHSALEDNLSFKSRTLTASELGVTKNTAPPSGMNAKSYCLIEADSKRILVAKDQNNRMPMASTTKIMTCILALENGRPDDIVTVSDYAASMPDVQLGMKSGDTFYLKDLLYSLMLESHNDTAVAIAEHIGGSVEVFARMMNDKAAELGCTDTNFVTPNGLDAREHYTTAYELCLIASYAIKNQSFLDIISTSSHQFGNCSGTSSYQVYNKDLFLTSYDGALGIKTGFTGNAGYCFCGAAKRGDLTLISSVLACGWPPHKTYKWLDTKKLMDYGFNSFKNVTLSADSVLSPITVYDGQCTSVRLRRTGNTSFSIPLTKSDTIKICYEIPDCLTAPVRQGDIIGYENYLINDKTFVKIPLAAQNDVKKIDMNYIMHVMSKLFFSM